MGTTVKVRQKYQITIPEDVRKKIPLSIGERVEVIAKGNEILIRPVVEIPRDQAWFWESEWQTQVQHSLKDIKEGKFKRFRSVKEAREHLGD